MGGRLICPEPVPRAKQRPVGRKGGVVVKPACVWVAKPDYLPGVGQKAEGDGGGWYQKFCRFGDYETLADFEGVMGGWDVMNSRQGDLMRRADLEMQFFTTPPPVVVRRSPQQVMASVADDLPFPDTFLAVSPVATSQVVRVPTWVWLTDENGRFVAGRYRSDSKTIVLEGYPLRWQIVPALTVTPGTGGEGQVCDGAGVPWSAEADGDPGACTVLYDRSGRYVLSASVAWTVQWWLGGVRQDDITGPVNTATRPVTVLEVQTATR